MLRTADTALIEFRRTDSEKPAAAPLGRGGLLGLLGRLGLPVSLGESDDKATQDAAELRLATSEDNHLRALRANAHAAFRTVEGSPEAALDTALMLYETELRAARAERDNYAEALKTIQLYATDAGARSKAAQALTRPRGMEAWDAGLHVAGRDRFPFMGELDA
jgi:hypothetical protein